MHQKNLKQIVNERPFHDYADWWEVGPIFSSFMAEAIVSQWSEPYNYGRDLQQISSYVSEYLQVVFNKEAKPSLVKNFIEKDFTPPIQSGEFDALSYAFYRSAFESIEKHNGAYEHPLERERRLFTVRVGKVFFKQLHQHLNLELPPSLANEEDFDRLKSCIQRVGAFLKGQGYLRDHFAFLFDLEVEHAGRRIVQTETDFIKNLKHNGVAYAIYEMGYPIILPSAVYLFHTMGEAQHHSSRTIEELFSLAGCDARETDDFDPTDYPSDRVVELWEIRKIGA